VIAGFGAAVASSVSAAPGAADAAIPTDPASAAPQDAAADACGAKAGTHAHARLRVGGDRFAALLAAAAPAASIVTAITPATNAVGTGEGVAEASANSESAAAADAALPDLLLALIGGTSLAGQPATPAAMSSAATADGAASPSTTRAALGAAGSGVAAMAMSSTVSDPAVLPGAASATLDVATTLSEAIGPDPAPANTASAGAGHGDGRTSGIALPGSVALPAADASLAALAAAAAASADPASRDPSATREDNAIATADAIDARTSGADPAPLLTSAAPSAVAARQAPAQAAPLALPADPGAGFDDAFGARIGWMAEQRIGHAELRVTPDHAGPIDVRLQLDGQRVSLEFHSGHAETRQALEASLPRLRDLLGQQGLQLAQADVGQRQAGDWRAAAQTLQGQGEHDAGTAEHAAPRLLRARGLLDEYA
jgi:flagellar hook-length control protein FliK